jgi:hypothetical protein
VQREILDHATLILSCEPTRTLSARALHGRIMAALGVEFGYAHLLETLGTRPDRFTVVSDPLPLGDWRALPDADRLAAQLEDAGVLRCATVVLADHAAPDEQRLVALANDELATALAATLADAHAAVVELLSLEQDSDATALGGRAAVLELDELRSACAARLRAPPHPQ